MTNFELMCVDNSAKKKAPEGAFWIFCFLVFLPQQADQAASAYETFVAFTLFSLITSVDSRAVHSVTLCPVETRSGPSKKD